MNARWRPPTPNVTLIADLEAERPGQIIVNAVAAGAGVDERLYIFHRKIWGLTGRGSGSHSNINAQGWAKPHQEIGGTLGLSAGLKPGLQRGPGPE